MTTHVISGPVPQDRWQLVTCSCGWGSTAIAWPNAAVAVLGHLTEMDALDPELRDYLLAMWAEGS